MYEAFLRTFLKTDLVDTELFKRQPYKMAKHTQKIRRQKSTNC